MPPPSSPVAAVDIGTNTVRLLVADLIADDAGSPGLQWIDRRSVVTRLGQGVDEHGRFAAAAVDRTIAVLTGYGEAIADRRCHAVRAIATSATRDAADREGFLDGAEEALGVRPEVVSGDEEASLAFAGATSDIDRPGPYLVIDVGGGSTELVAGDATPEYSVSVDIGSVRITERLLPRHPAPAGDIGAARDHVDALLDRHVALPVEPATVIGVAGTYTSLAAIHLDLADYDSEAVHGTVLDPDALGALIARLAALTVDETAAIPSLDPARAPVLLGGAIVAERAAIHAAATELVVSEYDMLDGIALSLAP